MKTRGTHAWLFSLGSPLNDVNCSEWGRRQIPGCLEYLPGPAGKGREGERGPEQERTLRHILLVYSCATATYIILGVYFLFFNLFLYLHFKPFRFGNQSLSSYKSTQSKITIINRCSAKFTEIITVEVPCCAWKPNHKEVSVCLTCLVTICWLPT